MQAGHLDYELLYPGAFPLLKVRLKQGETIKAESDAMVAMTGTVDVEGKLEGGLRAGLGRVLASEKFFFQTLTARRGPGEVLLAPAYVGDISTIPLDGTKAYLVKTDGFLASSNSLNVSTTVQNLTRGLFSGAGLWVLKVSGSGVLFVSAYGALHPVDVPAGEEVTIDNAHLVAWPEGMHYDIKVASSRLISSLTSGEWLVCRFRGPGRVLIQTRKLVVPSG
jgi:uncharacterized protein (TIGR00266 family)